MRRKGSLNDWHELLPVLNALRLRHITFARFAELGREWLSGATSKELRLQLPMTEAERVANYIEAHPGAYTSDIAKGTGLDRRRVQELLGRLRSRQQIVTKREPHLVRAWPRSRRAA